MSDSLTSKEKLEIAIQSGLQLVPYVGSSLSTAYFSTKQEKRFKRIESFYQELSDRISTLETTPLGLEFHDEGSLIALIERLNDEIEKESSLRKREYFKNYFIHLLQSPTTDNNYDERRMLLDSLSNITFLEFQILLSFSDDHKDHAIIPSDIDQGVKTGAISRLEMLGLLQAFYVTKTFVGQSPTKKHVSLSSFGKRFIDFCLE
ncbi:hypothetical protein M3685_21825 [Heyndrickxia oleronia]|uniref:hypothetical protein n=1 Tax=Heyndrickxia oleronia TaxID=38875 RepID=UPI00203A7589|nr:hypothetical protein [Heyndrickxia oleronia]MCM3456542.1 hypothetical protein [Heyndrickxia oleronia]